jgi:hypothetical protein
LALVHIKYCTFATSSIVVLTSHCTLHLLFFASATRTLGQLGLFGKSKQ